MGMRMDALREWLLPSRGGRLLVTSLEALLQRVPPAADIASAFYRIAVGSQLDGSAFERFVERSGYLVDGVVDEPGEVAILKDVIDIFPAGASQPMRCYIGDTGTVSEIWFYDPETQRTTESVDAMLFGPASEIISVDASTDDTSPLDPVYRRIVSRYKPLRTVFELLGPAKFVFDDNVDNRVEEYLRIIDDAREASGVSAGENELYLNNPDWDKARQAADVSHLSREGYECLPFQRAGFSVVRDFVKEELRAGSTVVIVGDQERSGRLCQRLANTLNLQVQQVERWESVPRGKSSLCRMPLQWNTGFIDRSQKLTVISCDEVLGLPSSTGTASRKSVLNEPDLRIGDAVVHEEHGIGVLRDLETTVVDEVAQDAVRLDYEGGASVILPISDFGSLWRYSSEPDSISLNRLHTDAWVKKKAKLQQDIAATALGLYKSASQRREAQAPVLRAPLDEYRKFIGKFPYSLTGDQMSAVEDIATDLGLGRPMDRLICGDVGFGKTELALRAAAIVALSGMQVVVIAPTTILARQHFDVFRTRFSSTGLLIELLSRAVPPSDAVEVKRGLDEGSVSILIATHAVLAKDVRFQKLGLVVIDEEHRFGARDKVAMRSLAPNVHRLAMTATPIPRTLQSALAGVQDVSLLLTPPARRRPVRTAIVEIEFPVIRSALLRERRRGGQSFFVAPQVADIDPLLRMLTELVPECQTLVAHGKMPVKDMEDAIALFSQGEADILLSTNIIESGLDIPRANTIFVWRPDRFGLAQLHQLRGRVGRGRTQGMAYLLTETDETLSSDSRSRLLALLQLDRLGSGATIAMQDLELRGGGSFFGEEQSGHIKAFGVRFYQELLAKSLAALQRADRTSQGPAAVDIGLKGSIPSEYVPDATVRLNLYSRILRANGPAEFDDLEDEMLDRFGDLPQPVITLLRVLRLATQASQFGVQNVSSGPNGIAIDFVSKPGRKVLTAWKKIAPFENKVDRILFKFPSDAEERLGFLESLFVK
jgi:transcription-repair coupling factor (superfamily II helicase)